MADKENNNSEFRDLLAGIAKTFSSLAEQFDQLATHFDPSLAAGSAETTHTIAEKTESPPADPLLPVDITLVPPRVSASTKPVQLIRDTVAQLTELSSEEIQSHNNTKRITRPRQIAAYLAGKWTTASNPQIAMALGGRHHTSIINARRVISKILQSQTGDHDLVFAIIEAVARDLSFNLSPAEKATMARKLNRFFPFKKFSPKIRDVVAQVAELSPQLMVSKSEHPNYVLPRQTAIYLIRKWTNASDPEIAKFMKRRDSSEITTAHQRIARILEKGKGTENFNRVSSLIEKVAAELSIDEPSYQ